MDLQAMRGVKKHEGCFYSFISIKKSIVGTFINLSMYPSPNSSLNIFLSFSNDPYLTSFISSIFFSIGLSFILVKFWTRNYFFTADSTILYYISMGMDSMGYWFSS